MRNHTIEIADKKSQVFKLHISTPSSGERTWAAITNSLTKRLDGHWRSLDKGFIRDHHGKIYLKKTYNSPDITTSDLYLLTPDGSRGMEIFEYEDWTGVNSVGTGTVYQPWVLTLAVGKFSWAVID